MKFTLPDLLFSPSALEPWLSAESFEYHHGKHHRAYVDKLNGLVEGTRLDELELTDVVRRAQGATFDNAAQHFNHSFFWSCLGEGEAPPPADDLRQAIERDFGSQEALEAEFERSALAHFGSGWCWLVKDASGGLRVGTTADAGCPLTENETPLLTCDLWEHAYYIDHRNDRAAYVRGFLRQARWDFASRCFRSPGGIEAEILGASAAF